MEKKEKAWYGKCTNTLHRQQANKNKSKYMPAPRQHVLSKLGINISNLIALCHSYHVQSG